MMEIAFVPLDIEMLIVAASPVIRIASIALEAWDVDVMVNAYVIPSILVLIAKKSIVLANA